MTSQQCTCGAPTPPRAISGPIWIADASEAKFGGRYERRDFCSLACAQAAPKFVRTTPRRKRATQAAPMMGDWAALGAMLGHKVKR